MAQAVKSILQQKGFNNVGTAAIMGNIEVETGGSFNYQQKQGGGGRGYGLFQFDFLLSYYKDWLEESGNSDSADSQVQFMWETIKGSKKDLIGSGNAAKIRAALDGSDLDNATTVFCNLFEKPGVPHLDRRLEAARKYL